MVSANAIASMRTRPIVPHHIRLRVPNALGARRLTSIVRVSLISRLRRNARRRRRDMSDTRTIDVSRLAPSAFGTRSLMWWGTMGLVLIEAMAFALTIGAYFYLVTRSD